MGEPVSRTDLRHVFEFYKALGLDEVPLNAGGATEENGMNKKSKKDKQDKNKKLSAAEKAAALEKFFKEEIDGCTGCKLSGGRANIVFGEGDPSARLMFIGEAPGAEEDKQGRPFVGRAGKLLTSLIEKLGLKRDEVFIANIIKCRPEANRDPEEDEVSACLPYLKKQIEIIQPGAIIALGRVSAQTLLQTMVQISKLRGNFSSFEGIPLMPTFHPSYLLRNPKDKKLTWEDALQVLDLLGIKAPAPQAQDKTQ